MGSIRYNAKNNIFELAVSHQKQKHYPAMKVEIHPNTQQLLDDKNWRKTAYIELSSNNEYWSSAYLASIDKQVTGIPNDAIIYLMQRMMMEQEGWDTADGQLVSGFGWFVFERAYLASSKGVVCPIDLFWVNFEEIWNGITMAENFTMIKNGIVTKDADIIIRKEDIISPICFADKWNAQQYFIETKTGWLLFDWGTTV